MILNKHCRKRIIERASRYGIDSDEALLSALGSKQTVKDVAYAIGRKRWSERNQVTLYLVCRNGVGQTAVWTSNPDSLKVQEVVE